MSALLQCTEIGLGVLGTLVWAVMMLAGMANLTPAQVARMRRATWGVVIGGVALTVLGAYVVRRGHWGWGLLVGAAYLIALFVVPFWAEFTKRR